MQPMDADFCMALYNPEKNLNVLVNNSFVSEQNLNSSHQYVGPILQYTIK